jgi:hypothetical protein
MEEIKEESVEEISEIKENKDDMKEETKEEKKDEVNEKRILRNKTTWITKLKVKKVSKWKRKTVLIGNSKKNFNS